jgi:hypothetical protein
MNRTRRPIIIIAPVGGLCNRMRALDSAISLSEATDGDLYVLWYLHFLCNCRFDDLFAVPGSIKRLIHIDSSKLWERSLRVIHDRGLSFVYDVRLFPSDLKQHIAHRHDFDRLVAGKRIVYINANNSFHDSSHRFGKFAPIESLRKVIDSYTQSFDNVVGVHVRRTDNPMSIQYSPTSRFIERMEQEVQADSSTRFFVATDSPEEEEHLRRAFPNRIITYQKRALDRRDPKAIQDALIDLYCLSRCRKLIGSYGSSFTETAWQINGIQHIIAAANTR